MRYTTTRNAVLSGEKTIPKMAIKIRTNEALETIKEARALLIDLPPLQHQVFGNLKVIADSLIEHRQKYVSLYFAEVLKSAKKVKNTNISTPNAHTMTANFQHRPDISTSDLCMSAAKEFAKEYLNDGIEGTAFSAVKKTVNVKHLGVLSTTFTILYSANAT